MATNVAAIAATFTFSGHETFVLRSNWLKKAYDLLQYHPDLFGLEDAFVRLGVGKNMALSIRFWGKVCGVFERRADGFGHQPTALGRALLDSEHGWDPFLVTPASRWLLHWQVATGPDAFTWFYTFNLLRRGEFSATQLAQQIVGHVLGQGGKIPSPATIGRDVDCMVRCYVRPNAQALGSMIEDALHCPLNDLGLLQPLPGQDAYQLVSGARPNLPDELVAFAALQQARTLGRSTVAFNELAYAERSPGRVFRLDEDALLARLLRFEAVTAGAATYNEGGGIRQIAWRQTADRALDDWLLGAAFAERHHG